MTEENTEVVTEEVVETEETEEVTVATEESAEVTYYRRNTRSSKYQY